MTHKILFIERKFWDKNFLAFSIEKIFENISRKLPKDKFEAKIVKVPFGNSIFDTIRNILFFKKPKADIYHITGQINYLGIFLPRKKTVLTMHDLEFLKIRKGLRKYLIKKLYLDLPVKRLDFITAVSAATKAEIVANTNCPPEKIRLIENPLMEHFVAGEKEKFNAECPLILQVGIAHNKNLHNLIKALQGINCRLRIIGNLPEETLNILKASNLDYENAFGLTDSQMKDEYQKADIVAYCSTSEGFGLPIIEAQIMKTPVITSDISPLKEVSGGAAYLANPFDYLNIRQGILKIIADDNFRQSIVEKGSENIKRFDLNHITMLYEKLYSEVINN